MFFLLDLSQFSYDSSASSNRLEVALPSSPSFDLFNMFCFLHLFADVDLAVSEHDTCGTWVWVGVGCREERSRKNQQSHFLSDTSCPGFSVCFFLETLGEENCQRNMVVCRREPRWANHTNTSITWMVREVGLFLLSAWPAPSKVLSWTWLVQEGQSWQGSYYCTQGRTKFSLDITEVKVVNGKEQIQADLTFTIAKKGTENMP